MGKAPLFQVEVWDNESQPPAFQLALENPFYDRDTADASVKWFEDQGRTARVMPYAEGHANG
jgi:hypothetical protein